MKSYILISSCKHERNNSIRLAGKLSSENKFEHGKEIEIIRANKAGVLLYSRQGRRSQTFFKPLSKAFMFENESEKQRYTNHLKKLEELKEQFIAKPEQQLMIATAVIN